MQQQCHTWNNNLHLIQQQCHTWNTEHAIRPDPKKSHLLSETLRSLSIMNCNWGLPYTSRYNITMMLEGFQGSFNRIPMKQRDSSLSDSCCFSSRSSFSSLVIWADPSELLGPSVRRRNQYEGETCCGIFFFEHTEITNICSVSYSKYQNMYLFNK